MAYTFNANNPSIRAGDAGAFPIVRYYREADSQSFKAGQFVYLASGYATAVADDGTLLLGIARKDATNVTSGHATIPVEVITADTEIKIKFASGTPSAANLGKNYGLDVTSNTCTLDTSSVNSVFTVQQILYDESGTATGWVVASVVPAALQYGVGA